LTANDPYRSTTDLRAPTRSNPAVLCRDQVANADLTPQSDLPI
jgi:hypothetical protein